jgi:hypothetical protein
VITLEPPPPRAPGASILYGSDFYEAARAQLAPGGVVAQWLPLHGLSGWELERLVATFVHVFPDASLHLAERNEAILLSRASRESPGERLAEAAVAEDLAVIGLDGLDPWTDTLWADAAALRRVAPPGDAVRYAWPAPELFPFSAPSQVRTPDRWLEEIARARVAEPGSFAAIVGPAVPAFVRVREGRARPGDRARVLDALARHLARSPDDPYAQFMLGTGPLLERDPLAVAPETAASADP